MDADAPAFVKDAMRQIEAGAFEQAVATINAGLQSGPRSVAALLALAQAEWELVHAKPAIDALKEAIQLNPRDARPYALLGRYLLFKGLKEQALNFLDRAVGLDPSDVDTRKLRERAARQQQRQYTQIGANPLAQTPDKGGVRGGPSRAKAHKREATRILSTDPAAAAAQLAAAEHGDDATLDDALAALLGASLVDADVSRLAGDAVDKNGPSTWRVLLAFVVVLSLGALTGVGIYTQTGPVALSVSEDRVDALMYADDATSLRAAIEEVETRLGGTDDEVLYAPHALLAHVLLAAEHGGGEAHYDYADDLLKDMKAPHTRHPMALLGRAILLDAPRLRTDDEPRRDKTLRADVKAALDEPRFQNAPYALLAKARLLRRDGQDGDALSLMHQAALSTAKKAPRASAQLARHYAAKGDISAARRFTADALRADPRHTPSLIAAVVLGGQNAPGQGERANTGDKKAAPKKPEKPGKPGQKSAPVSTDGLDARAAVDTAFALEGVQASEMAKVALVAAAVALAEGDEARAGRMLQRVTEGASDPVVAARLTELYVLDMRLSDAQKTVRAALEAHPESIALMADKTRVVVAEGLTAERRRQLNTESPRARKGQTLTFPLGHITLSLAAGPLGMQTRFDPSVVPEAAIGKALDLQSMSAGAAERRLELVAELESARLRLLQGDRAGARKAIKRARALSSSEPEIELAAAHLALVSGDVNSARDAISMAQELAPADARVLLEAARLQVKVGDNKDALESLAMLEEEGFISPSAAVLKAKIALARGDLTGAAAAHAQARKLAPESHAVTVVAVLLADAVGDLKTATSHAEALWKAGLGPALVQTAPVAAAYTARAAMVLKDLQGADVLLRILTKAQPKVAHGFFVRGELERRRGDKDKATAAFAKATALSTGDSTIRAASQTATKPPPRRRRRRR